MTIRPPSGVRLPELVLVANRVLAEEAEALRSALEEFSNEPKPACPWEQDDKAISDHVGPDAQSRARLLYSERHQAKLIYVNAYDHLLTLSRILGADGAMPLFSHASVSRVVCEAAVRFAWLMDPDVSSEERLVRGAAALFVSEGERLKGVQALPAERFDARVHRQMVDQCIADRDGLLKLIAGAGLTFGYSQDGKTKVRLELTSPKVSVPLKINVTKLMAELLPESPSWYNIGSSVSHSVYWGLQDVDHSRPDQPLSLAPGVLDVGAAAESALSASGLIIDRCGRCFGHDPSIHVQRSRDRRGVVDALMGRATRSTWVHLPADPRTDSASSR